MGALELGESRTAHFELLVSAEGRVTGCTILQSSGVAALDEASCAIMRRRARFEAARDSEGKRVGDMIRSSLGWTLR